MLIDHNNHNSVCVCPMPDCVDSIETITVANTTYKLSQSRSNTSVQPQSLSYHGGAEDDESSPVEMVTSPASRAGFVSNESLGQSMSQSFGGSSAATATTAAGSRKASAASGGGGTLPVTPANYPTNGGGGGGGGGGSGGGGVGFGIAGAKTSAARSGSATTDGSGDGGGGTASASASGAAANNEPEGEIIGQAEKWVSQPSAQGCLYKCRITRDRKGMDRGMFPLYYLHLERDYGKKVFLLAGRKRKKSKTSNYIISSDPTDLSRQADGFVGKLRSNVFGTTFFVYDSGSKSQPDESRQDMAVVIYVSVLRANCACTRWIEKFLS